MTLEFWLRAEQFYNFWVWIIASGLAVSVIIAIFTFSYVSEKNRKHIYLFLSMLVLTVAGVGIFSHIRYTDYLAQESYVTPQTRDRMPRFAGYEYFTQTEEIVYVRYNDIENLRNLAIYQELEVAEPVIYLGKSGNNHYFETSDGAHFSQSDKYVKYTENAEQASIVGGNFQLIDEEFKNIGFKNPSNVMFSHIEIPSSQMTEIESDLSLQAQSLEEVFSRWNF